MLADRFNSVSSFLMAHTENKNRIFLYFAVFIANLVAFSAGIMIGWSSPVHAKLTNEDMVAENPLGAVITKGQNSWLSSIFGLGALLGPIVTGFLSNKFGRKQTLLLCSGAPLLIAYLTLAFCKTIVLYFIARIAGGFAFGSMLSVLPHFLSEISEDEIRGRVSSSMNVFLAAGTLYAFCIGPYLSIMWFNITCAVWPALFLVLFFLLVPESPYYLIASDDLTSATKSLQKFRSNSESNVLKEIETIKFSVEQDKKNIGSFSDIFKSKSCIKAFIITMTLLAVQQFSGIIVVVFNAQAIFSATGSDIAPEISTMIIGVVQFAASFITPLGVDKLGRKLLLLASAIGMFIAEVPMGLYFYLNENGKDVSSISWLPIICLIVYIISYNFGFGIVPWTVMAEVYPANVKAPASTVSACFCAFLGFALTLSFSSLNSVIGMGGTFWFFSACCAISMPFVSFYMIETKGRSFQEIQNMLSNY